jgi:hypothetical protein
LVEVEVLLVDEDSWVELKTLDEEIVFSGTVCDGLTLNTLVEKSSNVDD